MSFINPDQFAENILISDRKETPSLSFTNTTTHNNPCPFLRRPSGLISHKEAMEIINGLRAFYVAHSEKDILEINQHFQNPVTEVS